MPAHPHVIVLAGPNGAGKSTIAPQLLRGPLRVRDFVNADAIARGLSEFSPENQAIAAGKIMITRLRELADQRASFAFETTLASRSFAPWIRTLTRNGYSLQLVYLWLPSPEFAIRRVRSRVRAGGHGIPSETIRRRYYGGVANFFELYMPLATIWRVYNNSGSEGPKLIASGGLARLERIRSAKEWKTFSSLAKRR